MARRETPEINAGSMADIAFLLLIFFLVTTTMNVDSGISKKLSEKPPPDYKPPIIKEKNIFEVNINRNNDLLVEGEIMVIDELKEAPSNGQLLAPLINSQTTCEKIIPGRILYTTLHWGENFKIEFDITVNMEVAETPKNSFTNVFAGKGYSCSTL